MAFLSLSMARSTPDLGGLRGAIAGEVILPRSPDYETVRKPAISRFHDIRPQAVVLCADPEDVAQTIAFARALGLAIVVRSGGHCFAGRSSTTGIVVDVRPMRAVSVAGGVATIGAGARLGDVYDALARHGPTIAAGCGPTVGIAGLALGGGLGILGRKHGLTCDSSWAREVVLADGRVVDCDEQRDEDLFWALRGAGGGTSASSRRLALQDASGAGRDGFHLAGRRTTRPGPRSLAGLGAARARRAGREPAADRARRPGSRRRSTSSGRCWARRTDAAELLEELVERAGADPRRRSLAHLLLPRGQAPPRRARPRDDQPGGHAFSKSEFFRRPLPAGRDRGAGRPTSRPTGYRASRASSTSRPGAARTTACATDATAFAHRAELFLLKHAVVVEPGSRRG